MEKEADKRFQESKNIELTKNTTAETPHIYDAQSQSNESLEWSCNLYDMTCNCQDYYHNCRPCKHLYACMRHFLKEKNETLPEEDCFLYINAVYLLIHEPHNFASWNVEMRRDYPDTFWKPGRRRYKRKVESSKSNNKIPEIEYEIESVEGARILDDGSLEIYVEWSEGKKFSWAQFDKYSNYEFTKNFFKDLARYSTIIAKGKGRMEFDCVQRSSNAKNPYSFTSCSKEVSFPFHSLIVQFANKFDINLK
jgi:hypothetical protein